MEGLPKYTSRRSIYEVFIYFLYLRLYALGCIYVHLRLHSSFLNFKTANKMRLATGNGFPRVFFVWEHVIAASSRSAAGKAGGGFQWDQPGFISQEIHLSAPAITLAVWRWCILSGNLNYHFRDTFPHLSCH